MLITSIDELTKEATNIQGFLEITISDNIEEAKQRATDLSVYNARLGKMLADAKYHLNAKMTSEIMDIIKMQGKQSGASSTAINKLVNACCKEEQYIADWTERLSRSTVHQLDLIRSLMSYEKEMMRMTPQL
jgi:hypothetical protein